MSLLKALILGLVQGLTEFLPVSSSGHLVFAQHLLHVSENNIAFDVSVHLGTLLAVIVYFRQDLANVIVQFFRGGEGRRTGWMLILASVPTAIIGFAFKDTFEALFQSPRSAAIGLIATSILLFFAERVRRGERPLGKVRTFDALLVGTMQGLAIIPGVSRSGSTITAGLFSGLSRDTAARFSFLLSIPAIVGASLLEAKDMVELSANLAGPAIVGTIAAAISGYFAIGILMAVLRKGKLYGFSAYTLIVGLLGLLLLPA